MPPFFRNTLIRFAALIEQCLRWSTKSLSSLLRTLGRLVGLGEGYYIEGNAQPEQPTTVEPASTTSATTASRRQAGREVDSFRKMAQQIKQDRGA